MYVDRGACQPRGVIHRSDPFHKVFVVKLRFAWSCIGPSMRGASQTNIALPQFLIVVYANIVTFLAAKPKFVLRRNSSTRPVGRRSCGRCHESLLSSRTQALPISRWKPRAAECLVVRRIITGRGWNGKKQNE